MGTQGVGRRGEGGGAGGGPRGLRQPQPLLWGILASGRLWVLGETGDKGVYVVEG